MGSTGREKDSSRNNIGQETTRDEDLSNKFGGTFNISGDSPSLNDLTGANMDESSFEPPSGRPMSRWGNVSNLAGSP